MAKRTKSVVTSKEASRIAKIRWDKVKENKIQKISKELVKVIEKNVELNKVARAIATLIVEKKLK